MKIKVELELSATVEPSDNPKDLFVSHCPELDLYSQGKTEKSAVANLEDAAHSFLLVYIKNNLFNIRFREDRWKDE